MRCFLEKKTPPTQIPASSSHSSYLYEVPEDLEKKWPSRLISVSKILPASGDCSKLQDLANSGSAQTTIP